MSHNKDGVQGAGWCRCVTKEGAMLEPESFSKHLADSTDEYDLEYQDMMSHVDDLEWIPYGDKNRLSGTVSGVQGSKVGWIHGGVSIYWEQV